MKRKKIFLSPVWLLVLLISCGKDGPSSDASVVEEISFPSQQFKIVGDLRLPGGKGPHPVILFVHGDGPNSRASGGSYPPIMARMLRAGYATFAWDKPGTGESLGKFDRSGLFNQRVGIVLEAIKRVKKRPGINQEKIGLWGISQAGYIIPLVLEKSRDVAFVIAVSCPGEASVAQVSYMIKSQAICAGISREEADKIENYYEKAERSRSYEEYVKYKSQIDDYPALEKIGIKMRVKPREEWKPSDLGGRYFFNPISIIEKIKLPMLVFFGEKDTQCDPIQGMGAYKAALDRAGNKHYRLELVPGVDHCMMITRTGCLTEIFSRTGKERIRYAPRFLDTIEEWLRELDL